MNISKLVTFIFRNRTIFWDIPKWNRGQTKWDGGSNNNNKTKVRVRVHLPCGNRFLKVAQPLNLRTRKKIIVDQRGITRNLWTGCVIGKSQTHHALEQD